MTMLNVYNPKQISVAFSAPGIDVELTEFAEDSFVTLSRYEDLVTEQYGAHGNLQLNKVPSNGAELTIVLLQNSYTSLEFEGMYNEQVSNDDALPVIGNFTINDPNHGTTITLENAYMKTPPDYDYNVEASDRTWVFGCENYTIQTEVVTQFA